MLGRLSFVMAAMCALMSAEAPTEVVLHGFPSAPPKGATPVSTLTRDAAGNSYGTASTGGAANHGTVFQVSPNGRTKVIYRFKGGQDGQDPLAGVMLDAAGNMYGTTSQGGSPHCSNGCGVVFKIDAASNYSVLYRFSGGTDGATPMAGVILDSAGNLYGTTARGGAQGDGMVYRLSAAGALTLLYSFSVVDGDYPQSGVIRDADGNLYGTTSYGGSADAGVVYKLDSSNQETVLHEFTGNDGSEPAAGVIRDADANLYGTTRYGGMPNGEQAYGVVFKVDTNNQFAVLYVFTGGSHGSQPNG